MLFFDPRLHNLEQPAQYVAWDLHFIKQCDLVFAYMEETNPSGYGLAMEVGYAKGLNKTIIMVDEKSPKDADFERYFRAIHEIADVCFPSLKEGLEFLKSFKIDSDG